MTGELRRYLKRERDRAVRARLAAREREHVCIECGEAFTAASPDAKHCPGGACKQRAYRRRQRAGRRRGPEAIAA